MAGCENGAWITIGGEQKYVVCPREGSIHIAGPRNSKTWVCGQCHEALSIIKTIQR